MSRFKSVFYFFGILVGTSFAIGLLGRFQVCSPLEWVNFRCQPLWKVLVTNGRVFRHGDAALSEAPINIFTWLVELSAVWGAIGLMMIAITLIHSRRGHPQFGKQFRRLYRASVLGIPIFIVLSTGFMVYAYLSPEITNDPSTFPSPTPTRRQSIELPNTKLIFSNGGRLKAYNFSSETQMDLGLTGVTQYLWSNDGKLAVMVQGEYGGSSGALRIPKAHATTAGFNYLLYLVDLNGRPPKLLLPEVFGDVFWSQRSDGLYVSEHYLGDNKLLLGNQSGLDPEREEFLFVRLDGTKTNMTADEFNREYQRSDRLSPNGRYRLTDEYPFDSVVELMTGRKFPIKFEYSTSTSRSKWSPNGDRVAFIYHVDERATQKQILTMLTLLDILSERPATRVRNLPSGEAVDFDWVNGESLLVSQLEYVSQPGHNIGNIGVFNVVTDKFSEIIPSIRQTVPYTDTLLVSPDKKFFTYMESKNLVEEEIVVVDFQGNETLRLAGRDPTWEPISSASISKEDAARIISELPEVKDFLQRVPNGKVTFNHEDVEKNSYFIHVVEYLSDHTATFNWYKVNKSTGSVENIHRRIGGDTVF